jgi:crotonobetainyl-CoA:carnitine CoA-transferase CaiB-like acyl-CoA transferase
VDECKSASSSHTNAAECDATPQADATPYLFNGPTGPLVGIKILDISTVVAAPFAAALMADFGAEVIKVELPIKGDHIRQMPPHKDGVSLWSKVANRNKKGVTLDLRTDEGRKLAERLIAEQDVLVENFRPGTMDRWGLSTKRLFEINPHLIILRVTGFGQTGPYRNRPGFARIFEAISGFAHLCGVPEGAPTFPGYPISDALTGVFGAFAICSALISRNSTPGQPGQEIDLSASEAMLRAMDFLAIEYDQLGVVRSRSGNLNSYSAPGDVYRTLDGQWIALAVSAPTVFARLTTALQRPDLLSDPRFSTNIARLSNRAEIENIVRRWFAERTAAEAGRTLLDHNVSFSPINSIQDLFIDEHFKAREAIISISDAELGEVRMQNVVPRFSHTPGRVWRTGPIQGEHNGEIYGTKLGLSEGEINKLKDKQVI